MYTERFVVFRFRDEWLVSYQDRTQTTFSTLQDAERSAFEAATDLAGNGRSVSVLIIPGSPEGGLKPHEGSEKARRRAKLS